MDRDTIRIYGRHRTECLPADEPGVGKSWYLSPHPKNEAVERPIHFIYFNTPDDQPHFSHPQIFLHAERSSAVTIIEDHRALAGAGTS